MQNFESYLFFGILILVLFGISLLKTPHKKQKRKTKPLRGIETMTENGETVKSKIEARIANYLKSRGLEYEYEKPLILEGRTIKPDFYIKKYSTYLEFYGWYRKKEKYTQDADAKMACYKRNNIKVISLFPKDYRHIEAELSGKLNWLWFSWFMKTLFNSLKNLFS